MPERLSKKQDETNTILGEVQAALWLSESLILALLEANLLDTDTILEAIDIVIAAKKTKRGEDPEQGSRGSDKACLDQRQHRRREDDRQSGRSKTERANPSEAFNLTVTPGPITRCEPGQEFARTGNLCCRHAAAPRVPSLSIRWIESKS